MCKPAPGPRCASHLKESLARNKDYRLGLATNPEATDEQVNAADDERNRLLFELAGTRTGQTDLNRHIEQETDATARRDLETYRDRAREAYVEKVNRLRAVEAALSDEPTSDDHESHASPGSYLNPTKESIAEEVAGESALRDQMARESTAQQATPTQTVSAASYSDGKGGGGGKGGTSTHRQARTEVPRTTSAASFGGGKGGGKGHPAPAAHPAAPMDHETMAPPHNHDTFRTACNSSCPRMRHENTETIRRERSQTPTSASSYRGKGGGK